MLDRERPCNLLEELDEANLTLEQQAMAERVVTSTGTQETVAERVQ
jgi:hypothetical protein